MDSLYLKWIDYKTNIKYILGALTRDKNNNKYYFKLSKKHLEIAEKAGFNKNTLPFRDEEKVYESDKLFSIFQIRVPKKADFNDEELKELLDEYGMEEFDEFEFLKKTKGKLMTDDFYVEEEK